MRMKKSVLVSLLLACLPLFVMAQSNDDLYFIPKKKTEKKISVQRLHFIMTQILVMI